MITGERIRNIREDKDILQQELADAVGINVSVLSRIEKGTRQLRDDELVKIADKLNVSVDYLLGRTDEPQGTGFQKGLLGDINGDSPLAQKAREAMASIQVTPYEEALLKAYRQASDRDKSIVNAVLNPTDKISADDKYTFIHDTLTNLMGIYCERDNKNQHNEPGDYVWLYEAPPTSTGHASTPQIRKVDVVYQELAPIINAAEPEQQKLINAFINDIFHHIDSFLDNKTPCISGSNLIGVSKGIAEKHFQKHVAELTANQSDTEDDNKPKPTSQKRA